MTIRRRSPSFRYALVVRDYILALPSTAMFSMACYKTPCEMKHGIRIVDNISETRDAFTAAVSSVLGVIARVDPLRLKRVQKEIRTILRTPGVPGSTYHHRLRLCAIDVRSFYDPQKPDPELAVQLLACSLVREATYGYLLSRDVLVTRVNRARFFDVCYCKEVQRFLSRLGVSSPRWDPADLREMKPLELVASAATGLTMALTEGWTSEKQALEAIATTARAR